MKLTEAMASAFDAQITLEFEASLVYRQLAIQMDTSDLPGMALWLRRQADLPHRVRRTDRPAGR